MNDEMQDDTWQPYNIQDMTTLKDENYDKM
jgi:hypothetical protein